MWMREEYGSHMFFPDPTTTHFELPVSADYLIFEGTATVQGPSSGGQVVAPVTTGNSNRPLVSSNQKKCQNCSSNLNVASKWKA